MKMSVLFLFLAAASPAAAGHQRHGDQMEAFEARRDGRMLPAREIERRTIAQMPGAQYLGFDFDSGNSIYTLKFLRDGSVIWVEVDGRTGQIVGRTGR